MEYDGRKARGDWKGFCSAKCQHEMAARCGFKKNQISSGVHNSEYTYLKRAGVLGDVHVVT